MDFRKGKFLNPKSKKIWEIGYNNIKHPKEYKQSVVFTYASFVYGKDKQCYNFYYGIGKQKHIILQQYPDNVGIRVLGTAGLTLAVLKPIYYHVYKDSTEVYERFQPYHQPGTIYGKAPFRYGLNEITVDPGVYGKLFLSFNISKNPRALKAIEFGFFGAYYLKPLEIMAIVKNYNYFVALFLSYHIGSIYQGKRRQVIFD